MLEINKNKLTKPMPLSLKEETPLVYPLQYFARYTLAWGLMKKAALMVPFLNAFGYSSIESIFLIFVGSNSRVSTR